MPCLTSSLLEKHWRPFILSLLWSTSTAPATLETEIDGAFISTVYDARRRRRRISSLFLIFPLLHLGWVRCGSIGAPWWPSPRLSKAQGVLTPIEELSHCRSVFLKVSLLLVLSQVCQELGTQWGLDTGFTGQRRRYAHTHTRSVPLSNYPYRNEA